MTWLAAPDRVKTEPDVLFLLFATSITAAASVVCHAVYQQHAIGLDQLALHLPVGAVLAVSLSPTPKSGQVVTYAFLSSFSLGFWHAARNFDIMSHESHEETMTREMFFVYGCGVFVVSFWRFCRDPGLRVLILLVGAGMFVAVSNTEFDPHYNVQNATLLAVTLAILAAMFYFSALHGYRELKGSAASWFFVAGLVLLLTGLYLRDSLVSESHRNQGEDGAKCETRYPLHAVFHACTGAALALILGGRIERDRVIARDEEEREARDFINGALKSSRSV